MKHILKKKTWARACYRSVQPMLPGFSLRRFASYFRFWITFRECIQGAARCRLEDMWIEIGDWHESTPLSYYFYQDTWAFHRIARNPPTRHVDIGSTALLFGCLAGIVATTSVDARPGMHVGLFNFRK